MVIGNANAIDQIAQSNQSDQAQLLIDSYIIRFGTCGIKRKDYMKYAVKNIQRIFLKEIMDYCQQVLNNEVNNYDEEFNNYVEIVKQYTKLEDNNLIYKLLPIIDKLLNHRKVSQNYLLQLNIEIKNLKLIQYELDETVYQFTQSLTSLQLVQFIKGVERLQNFNRSLLF
ncbi:unnamed protein product [Paramecium primaurelia]|uniref:Uncharacterized protein n=1 Tax=Paramecium primaurelia TaxID=5886 RepID=A0A8S1QC32_PARPR|nr:unnamed protein product [Paramecium primaurelia]